MSGPRREWLLVAVIVLAAGLAHGANLLGYPAFSLDDDEGTYAQQAWSVLTLGTLAPYGYVYDHAPAGWLLLAGWLRLIGSPTGDEIAGGRFLMLAVHCAAVALLWLAARRLGAGIRGAAVATLLFSLSPLAVFYQRLVLLDGLAAVWCLLALALLLGGRALAAGVALGVAVLTKETALVLAPALAVAALLPPAPSGGLRRLAAGTVGIGLLYPAYAASRGELGSLRDAISWQLSRGGPGDFLWYASTDWLPRDPVLLLGGLAAGAACLAVGLRDRRALAAGLLALSPFVYFARGGVVFPYYVAFAVPFLCLAAGIVLGRLPRWIGARAATAVTLALVLVWAGPARDGGVALVSERPDRAARDAIAWIAATLPRDARIVGRDDMWTALRAAGFTRYHSHWRMALDPAFTRAEFPGGGRDIDYLVISRDMPEDFAGMRNDVAADAYRRSTPVVRFASDPGDLSRHAAQYVEIRRVDYPGR